MLDIEMPELAIEPPAFLAPQEFTRLEEMRFPKRRAEWLHGRRTAKTLLRSCHPACFALSLPDITIMNEPEGAPFSRSHNGERLPGCLSISHRDRLAVSMLVLAPYLRLGVDLEKVETRQASFVEDFFTPLESEHISALAPEDRPKFVTLIWSAKEAALKALGQGLRLDTRTVEITTLDKEEFDTRNNGWERFEVASKHICGAIWDGWWRPYENYVLTVAAFWYDHGRQNSSPGIILQEIQPGLE